MTLLLACTPFGEGVPPPGERVAAASQGEPSLSVLTYNVNFEWYDLATVDAIAAADADLVFLQETTRSWEALIGPRFRRDHTVLFHPFDPDGGQGVLARGDVEVVRRVASPVGMFPATCLRVDTALGWLDVVHVHLHPPLENGSLLQGYFTTEGKRRSELQVFLECFDGPPDLVVGDFNEGEGAALELLEARGLRDAASVLGEPTRTWQWSHWTGDLEGRPDHVYVGPGLVPTVVEVREEGASDHRPLRVELRRE